MPIDHTGIDVPKDRFDEVVAFYLQALAPLRAEEVMRFGQLIGIGPDKDPEWWIAARDDYQDKKGGHFAFKAPDRATVSAFHEAALKAGGKCNGPPGLRPMYHANYFAAFVHDPLGNNIEACCHCPEG